MQRMERSEEKYQFGKSASEVQKFYLSVGDWRANCFQRMVMPRAAEFVIGSLQIVADCRGRIDSAGLAKRSRNWDKAMGC